MALQSKLEGFIATFEIFRKRLEENTPFDIVIIGGGLAGLTLAIQIKRTAPKTEILVLEKQSYPAPEAAFKVGESSIEGGAYYFSHIVGMKEHLESKHLYKRGFCFFLPYKNNTNITQRPELGTEQSVGTANNPNKKLDIPAYQIDRGRFENALVQESIQLGVVFLDSCKVTDFVVGNPRHAVTFYHHKTEFTIETRWVVDASGTAGFLKRRFNLAKPVAHDINAAWFRVNEEIDINNWSQDPDWTGKIRDPDNRRLCTCHLCGTGYWVWIIPLGSKATSIGIVADPALHSLKQFNHLERAIIWLEQHEPELAQHIDRDKIMDFKVLKHFASNCKQVFSPDRWAITGVAGVFADPLYSPGSELISISNIFITDLILKDLSGQPIDERVAFYSKFYLDFLYKTVLCEYQNQYPLLGNAKITIAKKLWQAAWYWATIGILIYHHKCTDLAFMRRIEPDLQRLSNLHAQVQSFFIHWHEQISDEQQVPSAYVNYSLLPFIPKLRRGMAAGLDDNHLKKQIAENITLLEDIATVFFQQAPDLIENMPSQVVNAELMDVFDKVVWQPLSPKI